MYKWKHPISFLHLSKLHWIYLELKLNFFACKYANIKKISNSDEKFMRIKTERSKTTNSNQHEMTLYQNYRSWNYPPPIHVWLWTGFEWARMCRFTSYLCMCVMWLIQCITYKRSKISMGLNHVCGCVLSSPLWNRIISAKINASKFRNESSNFQWRAKITAATRVWVCACVCVSRKVDSFCEYLTRDLIT